MFILPGHAAREDGLNSHREVDSGSGHFKLHKSYMFPFHVYNLLLLLPWLAITHIFLFWLPSEAIRC